MKRTIVAILAISPALLHAQTNSPAQPRSTPVLQSSLVQPVAMAAIKSADSATATASSVRVSTYTPPKRIHSVDVDLERGLFRQTLYGDSTVVIEMIVDQTGKPENLSVLKSAGQITDSVVLAAISQYRYSPATLNGQAIPAPVKVEYTIQQSARY